MKLANNFHFRPPTSLLLYSTYARERIENNISGRKRIAPVVNRKNILKLQRVGNEGMREWKKENKNEHCDNEFLISKWSSLLMKIKSKSRKMFQ